MRIILPTVHYFITRLHMNTSSLHNTGYLGHDNQQTLCSDLQSLSKSHGAYMQFAQNISQHAKVKLLMIHVQT